MRAAVYYLHLPASSLLMTTIIDFDQDFRKHKRGRNTSDMTVLVITLITAPLLIFILAAPIILCVDTETDDYCIRLGDMFSLRAVTAKDNPGVRLRIGIWKKRWSVMQMDMLSGPKIREAIGTVEGRDKHMSRASMQRFWRVLKTFRLSKCNVVLDTDDFILNAKLFPLFQFCNRRWGNWKVSFKGDCLLQLEVESRLVRVLYAWWWKR